MDSDLNGMRVAFLVANEGVEQVELEEPWQAVENANGRPQLVAPHAGIVQAMNHLDKGARFDVDMVTTDIDPSDYGAVVLPGGVANPDQLRMDDAAVVFVKAMFSTGKPAAAICHGPWTLIEADVARDRTLTSWPSLRTDICNAGGHWVDEEVKVCTSPDTPNVLVTSRRPDDLPAFCQKVLEVFADAAAKTAA